MTGEWTRSDGKPLPQNGTFWCKKETKETPEGTTVVIGAKEQPADWLLIGLCTAGAILLLSTIVDPSQSMDSLPVLFMAALWCVCLRKKKTEEPPPPPPPPPTKPPSEPLSLPSVREYFPFIH